MSRKKDLEVELVCEWSDCTEIVPRDFIRFRDHVEQHIHEVLPNYSCQHSTECVPENFTCPWKDCGWDSPENSNELVRHILFHAFHTNLKANGTRKQTLSNLSQCNLDSQGRNLVPDLQKPFFCEWEECDFKMNCPYWFYQHVDSHVMSLDKQTLERDGVAQTVVACGWTGCTFVARNYYKLKEHCRTHTHEKVYACSFCGGMFASMSKFTDHLTRQNTSEFESFQCSHCLKHCGSQRILRDHMRHHVNNIKCKLCDMTCPNPSALKQHMKFRHSDDRPHECDLCDARCKTLSDLRRHRECHNSVLSYECSVEGCTFTARAIQTLKRHFRIEHQGEKVDKYECHLCSTRYTRGTGLTQHLKTKHKFRWPSGHPRFRYKEHEDGIWRLQTVRFESLQLSQQFVNEDSSLNEDESNEDASYIQYETIDSPSVASLGTSHRTCSTIDNQQINTNNPLEDSDNQQNIENQTVLPRSASQSDGIQYIVLPYNGDQLQIHNNVNVENVSEVNDTNNKSSAGPTRSKRHGGRKRPYQRPSSPSIDIPQTLLALQDTALRLSTGKKD